VIASTPGARRWAARFAGFVLEGRDSLSHSAKSNKFESLQVVKGHFKDSYPLSNELTTFVIVF